MLPFVKSLLPRLKQYSKNLDQTSIFIDKPWIMIDENKDQHHYVFHKDGRLIMSLNGSVQIGKWEFLAGSNSLLIDRIKDSMLLNQEFIEDGLMFLKKDGLKDHFFILINKNVIPDLDYEKYLKKCFINLKDLRKFASNNQKSYYATSLYSDSQYTNQSRYQSSVGDEIFDENLEAVHSETIINDGKSMAVINGKIGSVYYERNYETDENLSLKIRQSSNDRLTIGDIVLDENKNPVSGTFKFKPHILEKVNLISVMDGTIFTIKKEIKKKSKFFWIALTGTLITFTVFFIYYISSLPPGKNVQVTTWADIGASGFGKYYR
ncbi:MAG TPA: hypothetical protein DCO83_04650 [Mucilaginibacter sp.]|nr:hypothetical protein [Mucilaginibacter sp.]